MSREVLPDLSLESWQDTRDTLWGYVRALVAIRRQASPHHPFWWHVTLYVSERGLTTSEIPQGSSSFEIELDLIDQRAVFRSDEGGISSWPLVGQTPEQFFKQTIEALASCGIEVDTDMPEAPGDCHGTWDVAAVERFGRALAGIDAVFERFRSGLDGETSPVHLFGHHFDLSLLWLSGRSVEGHEASEAELASEQLTFGFSTGDDNLREPYFYVTAYPEPEGFLGSPLSEPAFWTSDGFSGAVLRYSDLRRAGELESTLARFLNEAHRAGAELMKA